MDSQQVLMPLATHQQPVAPVQQFECAICGTTQKLLRCAKCKTIYYCSTDHQHLDWPTHKQVCRQLAKQKINSRLQILTNGCSAININSNSSASSSVASSNHHTPNNLYYSYNPEAASPVLGTNENEIMHRKAESVTQDSNCSQHMGNVANSTTSDQMHAMQSGLHVQNSSVDKQSDESWYRNIVQQQPIQQSTHNASTEHRTNTSQQQIYPQMPVAQLSNYLINQHEKSSSYQIGAAIIDENCMENVNERRYEELCRNIINDMNQYGLSVVDDFLGREKGMQILNEVHNMHSAGVFKDGQLVNNLKSEQNLRTIRGDKISWVKGVEPECSNVGFLINQIDAVICQANAMRDNGKLGSYVIKERTKAMVACYPGSGSHYVLHVDNPNKDGRVITAIYYLNLNWNSKDSGGVLRIFPEQTHSFADIEPKFDRLIFFWSDKRNPHEVQPAHTTRYAITVWYFDANEREAALNRCKNSQNSNHKIKGAQPADVTTITNASTSSTSATTSTNTTINTNVANSNKSLDTNVLTNTCSSSASLDHELTMWSQNSPPTSHVKPIQVVLPNCYK